MNQQPNAVKNALVEIRSTIMGPEMQQRLADVIGADKSFIKKFSQVALLAISKNPDLLKAKRATLFTSCMECAADGLLPNGKEAALVAYGDVVQYMPMVRGIYKVAKRSGCTKLFNARVVYAKDAFSYAYGFEPTVSHEPALADPGEPTHVYAVVVAPDDTRDLEVMTKADVEKVRSHAKASNSPAWKNFFEEMMKKTVIHRIAKRLDLTPEMERVINRIETEYDFDNEEFEEGPKRVADGPPPKAEDFAAAQEPAEAKDWELYDHTGTMIGSYDRREWSERFDENINAIGKSGDLNALRTLWQNNQEGVERLVADGYEDWVKDSNDRFQKWERHIEEAEKLAAQEKAPKGDPAPKAEPQKAARKTDPKSTTAAEPKWIDDMLKRLDGAKTPADVDKLTSVVFKATLEELAKTDGERHARLLALVEQTRARLEAPQ